MPPSRSPCLPCNPSNQEEQECCSPCPGVCHQIQPLVMTKSTPQTWHFLLWVNSCWRQLPWRWGTGTDRGGMPVMSGIQILLGQWLLLACSLSVCVWGPCGSHEDLKEAVRSLSLTPQHSQAGPRLPCPIPVPDFIAASRDFAEGFSLFPSLGFVCLP